MKSFSWVKFFVGNFSCRSPGSSAEQMMMVARQILSGRVGEWESGRAGEWDGLSGKQRGLRSVI